MCLAGLLMRLFRLGHQSFWNDEILTIDNAGASLLDTLVGLSDPNILPLYYLIVRELIDTAPAEIWLRLPSVLFGTLSIPLFYSVIRDRGGERLALLGAALMAFSPLHVWYSQEARPYALLILLALVALRAVQLALERPTFLRKLGAVLTTGAVFYCHTIGIGFLVFLAVHVLLETPRPRWREWAPAGLVLLVLLSPGLARLFLSPPIGSADVFKPVTPWSLGYAGWVFATGYSLGPTPTEVHQYAPWRVVAPHLPLILALATCLGPALVSGALALRTRHPELFRLTIAWLTIPSGLAVAGAMGTVHPFNVRYGILGFPPFLLLLAGWLESTTRGWRRVAASALLAAIASWSLINYFFAQRYWRDDNRSAGHYLSGQARIGDLVVGTAGYTAQNLRYYYRGPTVMFVAYPAARGEAAVLSGPRLAPAVVGARYVVPAAVPSQLSALTAGHDRVWLFASRTYHSDPEGLIGAWLDRTLCRTALQRWPGVELRLYVRRGSSENCPRWGSTFER